MIIHDMSTSHRFSLKKKGKKKNHKTDLAVGTDDCCTFSTGEMSTNHKVVTQSNPF